MFDNLCHYIIIHHYETWNCQVTQPKSHTQKKRIASTGLTVCMVKLLTLEMLRNNRAHSEVICATPRFQKKFHKNRSQWLQFFYWNPAHCCENCYIKANNTAALIYCLGSTHHYKSLSGEVRATMSFLRGEALGSVAERYVSHGKCQGIMCDHQDLSVEGQQLSSPAERHGLSQRDQSRRPALTRLVAVQGGENVTVPLHLQSKLSAA